MCVSLKCLIICSSSLQVATGADIPVREQETVLFAFDVMPDPKKGRRRVLFRL